MKLLFYCLYRRRARWCFWRPEVRVNMFLLLVSILQPGTPWRRGFWPQSLTSKLCTPFAFKTSIGPCFSLHKASITSLARRQTNAVEFAIIILPSPGLPLCPTFSVFNRFFFTLSLPGVAMVRQTRCIMQNVASLRNCSFRGPTHMRLVPMWFPHACSWCVWTMGLALCDWHGLLTPSN